MHIIATIEAYEFSVQCFENATIVTYVGLRVKRQLVVSKYCSKNCILYAVVFHNEFNKTYRLCIVHTE